MVLIKFSKADGLAIGEATLAMKEAAEMENKAKKARDAAKSIIGRELLQRRNVNLDELPAATIVMVQVEGDDVVKVERKASERLDSTALRQAHPEIVENFTRPSVASYFSSLL